MNSNSLKNHKKARCLKNSFLKNFKLKKELKGNLSNKGLTLASTN